MLSVVVPVTNQPRYVELLPECLESIWNQSVHPYEVIVVQDGPVDVVIQYNHVYPVYTFDLPARVGVPNAFNIGVSVAQSELVLMVGCDDLLKPNCIEQCLEAYDGRDGFYWINIEDQDGVPYNKPCGHAMITKDFWSRIGGYPLESPGACDAALIAMIWDTPDLIKIDTEPLIIVRKDPTTYTGSRDPRWSPIILQTHDLLKTIYREKLSALHI